MTMRILLASTAGAALALAWSAPVHAQDADDPVAACRDETDTQADYVACLEDALRGEDGDGEPATSDAPPLDSPSPAPASSAEGSAPSPPAPAAAPATGIPTTATPEAETRSDRRWFGLGRRVGGEDATGDPEPAPAVDEPTGLGSERLITQQNRGNEPDPERESAHVVGFSNNSFGMLQVTLDNGQVWRQKRGDTQRVRLEGGVAIPVELWATRFGGFRLQLINENRILPVERVR